MTLVERQDGILVPGDLADEVKVLRKVLEAERDQGHRDKLKLLREEASATMRVCLKIAVEKGASSWVSASPSYDHDTVLSKADFIDAVYIRYGWTLPNLPDICPCGPRLTRWLSHNST